MFIRHILLGCGNAMLKDGRVARRSIIHRKERVMWNYRLVVESLLASDCRPTRSPDAGRGSESFDALLGQALLRREIS